MQVKGHVFKYNDNVDTDVIIPARYLNTANAQDLAAHCMEDIDQSFANNVQTGDIIVAGWNFGCGSSREHAPLAIKTCGTGQEFCPHFLPQRHQYRYADPGMRSRSGRHLRRG